MKAVLFDMDGVIVANSDYHVKAWTMYAREYGRELTEDDIKRRLGFNNKEYMRFVLDREPTDDEVADAVVRKEALYREIYAADMVAPEGMIAFLDALKEAGVIFAIATGAPPENVDFVLDGLGIRKYFVDVVDSSQVEHGKPAPDTYLAAAERVGVPPDECIVIEDAIAGIEAGKRAGMKVIAITASYPADVLNAQAFPPDRVIESFSELNVFEGLV